jgi:hypothetical protein
VDDELCIAAPAYPHPLPLKTLVVLDRWPELPTALEKIEDPLSPLLGSLMNFPRTPERQRTRFELVSILSATSAQAAALPAWEPWCTRGVPRKERLRLAFCARVEGRVLDSTHGPSLGEAHVAVISDFQIVVIRLPEWEATPKRGTNVIAIGPLFRARDGQREVQAFRFQST